MKITVRQLRALIKECINEDTDWDADDELLQGEKFNFNASIDALKYFARKTENIFDEKYLRNDQDPNSDILQVVRDGNGDGALVYAYYDDKTDELFVYNKKPNRQGTPSEITHPESYDKTSPKELKKIADWAERNKNDMEIWELYHY